MQTLRDGLALLALLSVGLTTWRWIASWRFPLHERKRVPPSMPGVTFLKPLKGCDAETRECLRSWFLQDYPGSMQILLGVAADDDPVCEIARQLLKEFPKTDADLVICGEKLGANAKVSTLRQLEARARHPFLMISDADVRVPQDFAAQAAAPLSEWNVGLVNCFYRLANPANSAMRWEAVAVNADFWTQVLQAKSLGPIDFALGAVMTLPAAELKAIGGFAALSDFLADDYELGQKIAARDRRILFTQAVAECWDAPMDWGAVWRHQVRWARTIRACRPASFFFSVLNNSTVWPVLLTVVALGGGSWPWAGVGAAAIAWRMFTGQQQHARMNGSRAHVASWWLFPLKDMLDFLIWGAAFGGARIEWRGDQYRIVRGGRLQLSKL